MHKLVSLYNLTLTIILTFGQSALRHRCRFVFTVKGGGVDGVLGEGATDGGGGGGGGYPPLTVGTVSKPFFSNFNQNRIVEN